MNKEIRYSPPILPETCRRLMGLRTVEKTITYVKCGECGGSIEVWSDENTSACLNCGVEWRRKGKK